jgi:hypothetical protein
VIIDATYNNSHTICQIEVRQTGTYYTNASSPFIKFGNPDIGTTSLNSTLVTYHEGVQQTTDISYDFDDSVPQTLKDSCNISVDSSGVAIVSLIRAQTANANIIINCFVKNVKVSNIQLSIITDDFYSLQASKTILNSIIGDNLTLNTQCNGSVVPPTTPIRYLIEDKKILNYIEYDPIQGYVSVKGKADTSTEFTIFATINDVKVSSIMVVLLSADTYSHTLSKSYLASPNDSTTISVYKNGYDVTNTANFTCNDSDANKYIKIENNKITQIGTPSASQTLTFHINIIINGQNVEIFNLDVLNPYPEYVRNDNGTN